jgi:hypothetical protein
MPEARIASRSPDTVQAPAGATREKRFENRSKTDLVAPLAMGPHPPRTDEPGPDLPTFVPYPDVPPRDAGY